MLVIDDREMTQHPEIPSLLSIPIRVIRLEAADYSFVKQEYWRLREHYYLLLKELNRRGR